MSEIRKSEIDSLGERVQKQNYKKYLRRVILRKVRGFEEKEVRFDFPVTALIGPNGGGKTTILGAAALAYRPVEPSRFFAKAGKEDGSMVKWSMEHGVIDKDIDTSSEIRRSVNFPSSKWNRKPFDREVLVFGVTRTVPATERSELKIARGNQFQALSRENLSPQVIEAAQSILGKPVDGYSELEVSSRATLYAAKDKATASSYTEFHFGAGQASIIRIVSKVEMSDDQSLILIEEIENGLHPVAVRRLVDYLIKTAIRKKSQVIFTTHSSEAIAALPPKAIWAAFDGEIMQGTLNIDALRSVSGAVPTQLVLFGEDAFSERLLSAALRYFGADLSGITIHGLGGAEQAAKIQKTRLKDPTAKVRSYTYLDGDKTELQDDESGIFLLPGDTDPEAHVYDTVLKNIDKEVAKLTAALTLPLTDQERVKKVVREIALTNHDCHVIFRQVGEELDLLSETTVMDAFLSIWAQLNRGEIDDLFAPISSQIPMKSH